MAEVVCTGPARLHFGLADLSNATPRKYGGAGVMLSRPSTVISARQSQVLSFSGEGLEPEYRDAVEQAVSRLEQRRGRIGCEITVGQLPPSHVGLGSKTSFVLTVLDAIDKAMQFGLERGEIQEASGRGGTSGIGINGHFIGGFLIDAGHPSDGTHGPSSATRPSAVPPVMFACPVPTSWRFALLLPAGRRLSGADERDFFTRNTPIPKVESLETIAVMYHGVAPAFQQADLPTLRESLTEVQRVGFKGREVAAQSAQVRKLLEFGRSIDSVACGLSSIGPLVYVVHDVADLEALASVRAYAEAEHIAYLGDVEASPSGVSIHQR